MHWPTLKGRLSWPFLLLVLILTVPSIATHAELMIEQAKRYVEKHDIPTSRYEFQMIYGVRRDQQRALRKQGYNMRVYIPFGAHWYPYFMRRLAERPANVAFILTNLVRETLSRP